MHYHQPKQAIMTTLQTTTKHQKVIEYYEEAGLDYAAWSPHFNMHFGYWKWGMHPFDLEAMLNQMNQEVLNRLGIENTPLPMILDAGCGLGTTSRYMALRRPDACFYGVTVTPWQIEMGEKLNKEAGLTDQISLLRADYQNLPVAQEAFDAVFAVESACYAERNDKARFLNEMARVLRPGGKLVVVDGFRKNSRPLPRPLEFIYQKNMECWALKELADITQFKRALKAAGFKNIKVEDVSWHVAPSFAHIPKTVIKFYWDLLKKGEGWHLSRERKNNVLAPILGMLMGLAKPWFTYCIVTAEKA